MKTQLLVDIKECMHGFHITYLFFTDNTIIFIFRSTHLGHSILLTLANNCPKCNVSPTLPVKWKIWSLSSYYQIIFPSLPLFSSILLLVLVQTFFHLWPPTVHNLFDRIKIFEQACRIWLYLSESSKVGINCFKEEILLVSGLFGYSI